MKTTYLLLRSALMLFLTLCSTLAHSQQTPRTLLWQLSGNGLEQPSYVFGTIHALCPEQLAISDVIKQKLKQTEQLSLEVDMDAPNFMAEMMQSAMLPDGKRLQQMFSPADYKLLAAHLSKTTGLDIKLLDNMKPFMLQSLLLSQLTSCEAVSYEQRLMEMAHAQGKEVIGVETIREQLSAMDKLPQHLQTEMIVKTVKDLDKAREDYVKMVKVYLAQDLEALAALTRQDMTPEEYELYQKAFIVERNLRWIPVMEREARGKSTFFAFGAGHLMGKEGVLELLRLKGYTITPVFE